MLILKLKFQFKLTNIYFQLKKIHLFYYNRILFLFNKKIDKINFQK